MRLTSEIVSRVDGEKTKFSDPCIICGGDFHSCGHTVAETSAVVKQVRNLTKDQRKAIEAAK